MTLKIICECGTKYSFEVDPTATTMPFSVACPKCGLDGTEKANVLLAEQPSATAPEVPNTATENKSKVRLRLDNGPMPVASAPVAPGAHYGIEYCNRHTREPASERCVVCQKPICPRCMEQFGYLCSVRCKYDAEKDGIEVPVCKEQKFVMANLENKTVMLRTWVLFGTLLGSFILYVAYYLYFSKPKPVYAINLEKQRSEFSRFLSPEELLVVQSRKVSIYSPQTKKEVWVTVVKEGIGSEFDFERPGVAVTESAIFLANSQGLYQFDRKSGAKTVLQEFQTPAITIEAREPFISVVLRNSKAARTILTLNTEDAKIISYTEDVKVADPVIIDTKNRPKLPPTSSNLLNKELSDKVENDPTAERMKTDFVASPRGPIRMEVELQELKGDFVATVRAAGASKLNGSTRASSNVRDLLNEISNDSTRQGSKGSKWINQSRYKVRLSKPNNTGPGWRGEVNGDISFFPLQTVCALFSGPNLTVLDGIAEKKLFESKLNYEIDDRFKAGESHQFDPPATEREGKLYVYDAGVLSCFEIASGNVVWRLTSVGIQKLTFDNKGFIYVSTTGRTPESIQYSEQSRVGDRDLEVLLKVEEKTGVVKWKIENLGSDCHLSGKYLYTTSLIWGGFTRDPEAHFRVYRIHPDSGKQIWEYYHKGSANGVSAQGRSIALDYGDKIEVIKYFDF
ncbi:MAG: Pyrrolo-quinoline quinone [Verrucomicrobiales bacterium]|nr:Pyrrolo-quinoline quinone [Verrucomicrobiales bacterium]